MMLRTTLAALTALVLCASTPALAKGGSHKHDGFFLRLSTGLGYLSSSTEDKGGEEGYTYKYTLDLTGFGGVFSVAPGYAIGDNFIINADLFGGRFADPDYDWKTTASYGGGSESDSGSGSLKGVLLVYAIGAGVTYYLQPSNIYLAGSVGKAWGEFDPDEGETPDAEEGYAVNLMVGKEWWVADQWGLGVAGQFMYFDIDDTSTMIGGVLFTATFN